MLTRLPKRLIAWLIAWLTQHESKALPLPWAALWRLALPLWLTTRLLLLLETYLADTLLRAAVVQAPRHGPLSLGRMVNDWGTAWDGKFYARIVREGYSAAHPIDAAFWPLYPLLAKPLALLLGPERTPFALVVVSNLATLLAFVLLGALAVQELETLNSARRAVTLLAAAPFALFLTAAYGDSLFLACAIGALLTARRGQWRLAALAAFLAALTRPTGVVLILPLLYELGKQQQWRMGPKRRVGVLLLTLMVAGAVPLAMALYSLVCLRVYGDPLAWLHAERLFGHVLLWPWAGLGQALDQVGQLAPGSFVQTRVLLDLVPLLLSVLLMLVILARRQLPVTHRLYLVGLVLLILCSAPIVGAQFPEVFVSAGRYLLAAIPLYLVMATWLQRWPWLETAFIGGGFAVQALLVAFLMTGGWLV